MSGSKISFYELEQERIRRERAAQENRIRQDIRNRIKICEQHATRLTKEYKSLAVGLDISVSDWIREINNELNSYLTNAQRNILNLENHIQKQEYSLRVGKRIKDEKIARVMDYFNNMPKDYPSLYNEGVSQRVDIYRRALDANPDNKDTIQQIENFKVQFQQMIEDYEQKKAEKRFIKDVIIKTINGDSKDDGDGGGTIVGNIDGMPITVILDGKSNNINFITPEDGSCKRQMDGFANKLAQNDIKLGPIRVGRTGEVLNRQNTNYSNTTRNKIRS
ncbi:MAG: hypothetical protein PHF36_05175 [Candidatus Cloacimonetes bacterium]|nr:hypothetical protein [Candidatus Cloacimonadota bacterium]